jgi:hypothetical protein
LGHAKLEAKKYGKDPRRIRVFLIGLEILQSATAAEYATDPSSDSLMQIRPNAPKVF